MEKQTEVPNDATTVDVLNSRLRRAVATFDGKWKLEILWLLRDGAQRFNALRRGLPGITQHTLTNQLRELERDGMVTRVAFPEVPPRVEYRITEKARLLAPVFRAIFRWAKRTDAHTPDTPQNGAR